MELRLFKTMWGAVGAGAPYRTFADAIPAIADEGWDGVVFALIARQFEPDIGSLEELRELCDDHDLGLATMIMTDGPTVADHLASYRSQLVEVSEIATSHVISHSGLDAFSARGRCRAVLLV